MSLKVKWFVSARARASDSRKTWVFYKWCIIKNTFFPIVLAAAWRFLVNLLPSASQYESNDCCRCGRRSLGSRSPDFSRRPTPMSVRWSWVNREKQTLFGFKADQNIEIIGVGYLPGHGHPDFWFGILLVSCWFFWHIRCYLLRHRCNPKCPHFVWSSPELWQSQGFSRLFLTMYAL